MEKAIQQGVMGGGPIGIKWVETKIMTIGAFRIQSSEETSPHEALSPILE